MVRNLNCPINPDDFVRPTCFYLFNILVLKICKKPDGVLTIRADM